MADLRRPGALLADRDLRAMIDFTEPAGLLMPAVLHFVADASDPWALVARYLDARRTRRRRTATGRGSCTAGWPGARDAAPPRRK
jgi:hypothetical protein